MWFTNNTKCRRKCGAAGTFTAAGNASTVATSEGSQVASEKTELILTLWPGTQALWCLIKRVKIKAGNSGSTFTPRTCEAELGRSSWVQDQLVLHSEFQTHLNYTVKSVSKNKTKSKSVPPQKLARDFFLLLSSSFIVLVCSPRSHGIWGVGISTRHILIHYLSPLFHSSPFLHFLKYRYQYRCVCIYIYM